jgi:uncharacterized coiled-coil protein SlyX
MCDCDVDERLASIERKLAHVVVFVDELAELVNTLRSNPPPMLKMLVPALTRKADNGQ